MWKTLSECDTDCVRVCVEHTPTGRGFVLRQTPGVAGSERYGDALGCAECDEHAGCFAAHFYRTCCALLHSVLYSCCACACVAVCCADTCFVLSCWQVTYLAPTLPIYSATMTIGPAPEPSSSWLTFAGQVAVVVTLGVVGVCFLVWLLRVYMCKPSTVLPYNSTGKAAVQQQGVQMATN